MEDSFDRFLEKLGVTLVVIFGILGTILFVSGFRFLNPLDAIFRLLVGGAFAAGSFIYLRRRRRHRQWRRKRKIFEIVGSA